MTAEEATMLDNSRSSIDPVCAALLVDPRAKRAIDALRVALAVLAAAGHIVIDATPGGDSFVRVQKAPGPATPEHIVAVYRVLRDAARGGRLSRTATRDALAVAFGPSYSRYAKASVFPALVAGGMLHVETIRRLWLFNSQRVTRSAKGDALAKRVSRRLADLDTLPALVDTDPTRALQLARAAGPMLLLSPTTRTAIPRLQALSPSALPGTAYALIEEPEPEWLELFEHAETVLEIEFDSLLDAIEAIAGFGGDSDSGGSDSDGGGGDGGGGGGGD